MGHYFNEKDLIKKNPGIKTGVNTGIGLNLSDHVVLKFYVREFTAMIVGIYMQIIVYQREHALTLKRKNFE